MKATNPERHIQGDFRPFGITGPIPEAIVRFKEVSPMMEGLDLPLEAKRRLTWACVEAFASYFTYQIIRARTAGHAEARKTLGRISGATKRLAADLKSLPPEVLASIDKASLAPGGTSTGRTVEFLHFMPRLERLAGTAGIAADELKARNKGRPRAAELDELISTLPAAITAAGLTIITGNSGSRAVRKTVGGPGRKLIEDLLKQFDRHVTMSQVYGDLERKGLLSRRSP